MAKVFIEETTLTNIGNAIRDKEGSSALIPVTDMATRIAAISGGGGDSNLPEEALVLSGKLDYKFLGEGWNWYLDWLGNQITTKDVTSLEQIFNTNYSITEVPFVFNLASYSNNYHNCTQAFRFSGLRVAPKFAGTLDSWFKASQMFQGCQYIRNLDGVFTEDQFSRIHNNIFNSEYMGCFWNSLFDQCYSLRTVPDWIQYMRISEDSTAFPASGYSLYNNTFSCCTTLDEIVNMPVLRCKGQTYNNMFSYIVDNTLRLKNFTFETNNGTPYAVNWRNQTIDLSVNVGWVGTSYNNNENYVIGTQYNSGITADKAINNADTYQALKDDPDCYATDIGYSRYNHDSAVATINSLPDTSKAGGSNTIKFREQAGWATYEQGCGDLTEEEIAVAAAKGWTVTLV